ncbi:thioesterase family protein [Yimella sp. cx-51]|uniref:thioesterase family protein n=1 Tax=Yimella sp. cx-51 TaxID=2770551 RepID=UPI00165DA614|nr:thioesterase family protein [Yimella sp. cx-51]MBC9957535.1 thioesterase family protein [Yimella sp. cx-51]MBD2760776.1 thioesterase family protein [Yimella sp. cx-573]QTH39239.1 thioesterase family protein [Yimella sp. cx-51]
MSEFDDAISLRRDGEGRYLGTLTDAWGIGEAVNGGLLMALSTQAVIDVVPAHHPHPLTWSGVFLSPGGPGEITAEPTVLRTGRSMSTAQVIVRQGEMERFRALLTMGDVSGHSEPVRKQTPRPRITPVDQCVSSGDAPPSALTKSELLQRFDMRLDPETAGWALGQPSGNGEMRGWIRFADGREPDALSLLAFLDAFPPVAFDLGSVGWVPTIEFTGYVRAVPAPGWLAIRIRTSTVTGNLLEEDAELWDSTGRLVAQSRQLASARFAD